MASLLSPSTSPLQHMEKTISWDLCLFSFPRPNCVSFSTGEPTKRCHHSAMGNGIDHGQRHLLKRTRAKISVEADFVVKESASFDQPNEIGILSIHHVGILCENLERSLDFYHHLLGLPINEARPDDKLPYRGAWLWVGSEMIHLMELPNPDPLTGRPAHGGRDRHTCVSIQDVSKLKAILDKAGVSYTLSRSGRPAIFTRDPDANALEFMQVEA